MEAMHQPKSDFHTHFTANIAAESLIGLGVKHGVHYPCYILKNQGIDYDSRKVDQTMVGGVIRLADLRGEELQALQHSMHIPSHRTLTFKEMERIYMNRALITGERALQTDMLWQVARTYAQAGVDYVEARVTVFNEAWLEVVRDTLPAIEAQTGVCLRFMLAFNRHMPQPYMIDKMQQATRLATLSPYIAGFDFQAEETNTTRHFLPVLDTLAGWVAAHAPHLTVAVHAGESDYHPNNVKQALQVAQRHGIRMRIGHGLYGIDDETLALFRATGAAVERCPTSNRRLNYMEGAVETAGLYLAEGIPVLIGTDGMGIYNTSPAEEWRQIAAQGGLEASQIDRLAAIEAEWISQQKALLSTGVDRIAVPPPSVPVLADEWKKRNDIAYQTLPSFDRVVSGAYQGLRPLRIAGTIRSAGVEQQLEEMTNRLFGDDCYLLLTADQTDILEWVERWSRGKEHPVKRLVLVTADKLSALPSPPPEKPVPIR